MWVKNGKLILSLSKDFKTLQKEELLLNWFRLRGQKIFSERFSECIKTTAQIGIQKIPEWQIKIMPKRWGSCTKENKIYLNPELVAAPKPCIDYVIFHELCHIKEHNHSNRFFSLLSKVYSDWQKWKDYLNEHIEVRLI